jgi:hypothetical protein
MYQFLYHVVIPLKLCLVASLDLLSKMTADLVKLHIYAEIFM